MDSINFDELPFRIKAGKRNINWAMSVGKKVSFTYKGISGIFEIIEYLGNQSVIVRYDGKEKAMRTNNLLKCKLGDLLGMVSRGYVFNIGDTVKDDKRDIIITENVRIKKCGYNVKHVKFKCNKCLYESTWVPEAKILSEKTGCPVCARKKTLAGYNDIATEAHWMISYLANHHDATKYSPQSNARIYVKCPDCGAFKDKMYRISELYNKHSIGCGCKGSKSYPEKFMKSLLTQLNVEHIWGYRVEWLKGYKGSKQSAEFDFYLTQLKCVIEMDGELGHGKKSFSKSKITIEATKEKDDWKDAQAEKHGVTVIRINSDRSSIEYLKNEILNSNLSKIFNLSLIDWLQCGEFASKSIIKTTCEYYESNKPMSFYKMAKYLNLDKSTIRKYVNIGIENGWCTKEIHLKSDVV